MKVAIIGYGKMGKTIEKILLERNHSIILKIDANNNEIFTRENIKKADIAIEFSSPETAVKNYYKCFEAGIPVVSGTTAWLNKLAEVKQRLRKENATLFYAPNFSIGVNIFFKVNEFLSKLMNNYTNYNVEMEEIHHLQKLDSPSGTAIKTAEIIIDNIENKKDWKEGSKAKNNELLIVAKREENVAGTHSVKYISDEDVIEIIHTAKSRKGFALGAVIAAEWVLDKKGYFEMKDMLKF